MHSNKMNDNGRNDGSDVEMSQRDGDGRETNSNKANINGNTVKRARGMGVAAR